MRLTVRSPPMSIVPAASVVGVAVMSNLPQDQGPTHRRTCRSWSASRIFSVEPFQRHQLACDLHRTSCGHRLLCPIRYARSGVPDPDPPRACGPPVLVARPSGSRERPLGVAERLPSPITDAIRGGQPRPAEAAVDGRDGGVMPMGLWARAAPSWSAGGATNCGRRLPAGLLVRKIVPFSVRQTITVAFSAIFCP